MTPTVRAHRRVCAIAVMACAAGRHLERHSGDATAAAEARRWQGQTLQLVLLAMSRDQSVRIRRGATKLLAFADLAGDDCPQVSCLYSAAAHVLPPSPKYASHMRTSWTSSPYACGSCGVQLLQAVSARCRDKDISVRHEAYAVLQRFPAEALRGGLTQAQWRCILDVGLSSGAGGLDPGKGGAAGKHAAAIYTSATKLLHVFLMEGADGDSTGWVPRLGHLLGGDFVSGSGALHAAYSRALQEVLAPAAVLEACAKLAATP
jgi:hypothetical protein